MNKKADSMKNFWDEKAKDNAPFYIATWRGYERRDLDNFFLSAAEAQEYLDKAGYRPHPQARMLEIGCGIGRMTQGFAHHFGEIQAIDVSGEMIRQAKALQGEWNNIYFTETSGVDLSLFKDAYFDFVFSFIVFQHIPDKDVIFNYIREAGRVLKPGGIFRFQVNGLPDVDANTSQPVLTLKRFYRGYIRKPFKTLQRRVSGGPVGFEEEPWLGKSISRAEVETVCMQGGLTVTNVEGELTTYMWVTAKK